VNTWLLRGALVATLILTASAEYTFATKVGWSPQVAWALAVSLDVYVVVALRAKRDVAWAIGLMAATNVAAHSVEMIPGLTVDGRPVWWLVTAASVLPPLVLWRIHRLAGHGDDQPVTSDQRADLRIDQPVTAIGHRDQADNQAGRALVTADMDADIQADTTPDMDADTEVDVTPDTEADIQRTRSRTTARTSGRTSRPDTATAVARLAARHPDWSSAQIARRLGVTDRTVRRHLAATPAAPLHVVSSSS
jgi:hypothetical protein